MLDCGCTLLRSERLLARHLCNESISKTPVRHGRCHFRGTHQPRNKGLRPDSFCLPPAPCQALGSILGLQSAQDSPCPGGTCSVWGETAGEEQML